MGPSAYKLAITVRLDFGLEGETFFAGHRAAAAASQPLINVNVRPSETGLCTFNDVISIALLYNAEKYKTIITINLYLNYSIKLAKYLFIVRMVQHISLTYMRFKSRINKFIKS
jgi:hypothetical protein